MTYHQKAADALRADLTCAKTFNVGSPGADGVSSQVHCAGDRGQHSGLMHDRSEAFSGPAVWFLCPTL